MPTKIKRVDVVARDIDDWMFHFERQVGPRLKELFDLNLESLPPALASRLRKLRADEDPQTNDRGSENVRPHKQ